jgi:hypothetical protein
MTWGDAASFSTVSKNREELMSSDMNLVDKLKRINQLDNAVAAPPVDNSPTIGDLLSSAMRGMLGLGIARGASNILGLSEETKNKVENMGMFLGASSRLMKNAEVQDRRNAFKLAFVRAALDAGAFGKEAAFAPVGIMATPDTLIAPVRGIAGAVSSTGGLAGSLLGAADAPDEHEEELAQLAAQKEQLRDQLRRLTAEKKSNVLKQLLANRVSK